MTSIAFKHGSLCFELKSIEIFYKREMTCYCPWKSNNMTYEVVKSLQESPRIAQRLQYSWLIWFPCSSRMISRQLMITWFTLPMRTTRELEVKPRELEVLSSFVRKPSSREHCNSLQKELLVSSWLLCWI